MRIAGIGYQGRTIDELIERECHRSVLLGELARLHPELAIDVL